MGLDAMHQVNLRQMVEMECWVGLYDIVMAVHKRFAVIERVVPQMVVGQKGLEVRQMEVVEMVLVLARREAHKH